MKEREIKVTRNYSFWRHPIKWWKDRRKIALLDLYVNHRWENGMREEVFEMNMDFLRYGSAVMDKDGKRVDPSNLSPITPHT